MAMRAVHSFSEVLSALAERSPVDGAWDRRPLVKLALPRCPPRWTDAEDLLLAQTQGRLLPLLSDEHFGALAQFGCSTRRHRAGPPDLVIAKHAPGRRVLLPQRQGTVYLGRYERGFWTDLRAFMEASPPSSPPSPPWLPSRSTGALATRSGTSRSSSAPRSTAPPRRRTMTAGRTAAGSSSGIAPPPAASRTCPGYSPPPTPSARRLACTTAAPRRCSSRSSSARPGAPSSTRRSASRRYRFESPKEDISSRGVRSIRVLATGICGYAATAGHLRCANRPLRCATCIQEYEDIPRRYATCECDGGQELWLLKTSLYRALRADVRVLFIGYACSDCVGAGSAPKRGAL